MEGWIMLHRKLLDHSIFKNYKLLQVFLFCLLKASHKDHELTIGDQIIELKPGQLATGRKSIARHTGLSEQNVRTALKKLEKMGILTIKSTNKYSVISITKWDSHQQINQQLTSKKPATNQQLTTNKNVKNGNNENNGNKSLVKLANAVQPIGILLTNKDPFPIYQKDMELWKETYQAVNIGQELKKINAWLDANPTKRKTSKGMKRFINNWLSRAQDNPKPRHMPQAKQTHATLTEIVNDPDFDFMEP